MVKLLFFTTTILTEKRVSIKSYAVIKKEIPSQKRKVSV